MEKIIHDVIMVLAAFVFVMFIISFVAHLLYLNETGKVKDIEGNKNIALSRLIPLIKKCYKDNKGNYESDVCYIVNTSVSEIIDNETIIKKSQPIPVKSINITPETKKIIIKYEDGEIIVEEV